MNVICLEDKALYLLIDEVYERLQEKQNTSPARWIDAEEAMSILKIKSKTTLQQLRDEGKIVFSQPQKRIILYDRISLEKYIESHAHKTF